ncbi:hypothetical protein [Methylobacterium indicum]|uniref:Uncharacterized protein n=1 Tax=Methylobacterium indicum TaxID=1775910 RepID=A0ABR5HEV4_9HYPH|nr:hypothetical protein [Methylobacterium indicum]KMO18867.1 hypothetical protein QR78_14190 [Methylobacterium indicum]KMO25025.1 hypothetical protein QR79_09580 [Methylobacterium indicum]
MPEPAEQTIARLTRERDEARTALAGSERKRGEAESLLALRTRQGTQAQETWARAAEQALSGDPRALHDKLARWRDPARLAAIVQSATPTHETPHVES